MTARVSISVSGKVGQRLRAHCKYTSQVRSRLVEELIVRYLDGLDGDEAPPTLEQRLDDHEERLTVIEQRLGALGAPGVLMQPTAPPWSPEPPAVCSTKLPKEPLAQRHDPGTEDA